ncbi:MAG: Secretion system C-terminal sorting domain [Bacteroidota bacterium]|jgi:hypothetical protein
MKFISYLTLLLFIGFQISVFAQNQNGQIIPGGGGGGFIPNDYPMINCVFKDKKSGIFYNLNSHAYQGGWGNHFCLNQILESKETYLLLSYCYPNTVDPLNLSSVALSNVSNSTNNFNFCNTNNSICSPYIADITGLYERVRLTSDSITQIHLTSVMDSSIDELHQFMFDFQFTNKVLENERLLDNSDILAVYNTIENSDASRVAKIHHFISTDDIEAANEELAQMAGTSLINSNAKSVYTVMLKLISDVAIDSSDIQTLINIAIQCPYVGGTSVFQARSIVSGLGYNNLIFNSCFSNERTKKMAIDTTISNNSHNNIYEHTINGFNHSVYPSPTSDNITFDFFINTKQQIQNNKIEVFNTMGQSVLSVPVNLLDGKDTKTLSVSTLPSGVYFYKITNDMKGSFVVDKQ